LIYRSENVADRRPRIGNENIEMLMADVDGTLTFKPAFMTRWLNALPLITTGAESRFTLSGEVAYTIPNIYGDPSGKKNEAFIDDMEAIVDSYPMGVTIGSWSMASKPWNSTLARGRINWYNPKNILREQVEDPATLTDAEKKETVSVLALKLFPGNLGIPGSNVWSWGGVMKYLGNQLDFSQKKYIELLVKLDTNSGDPQPHPVMRIDLGDINEDFYTEYGGLNVLNNEDVNNDGVLTLEEDVGLDGIPYGEPGHDPNDLADNEIDQFGDYPRINGTEGNRVLDTEDLDGNGVLNNLDRYFSYSFSLTDSLYLENVNHDGWRLYRIPITDPEAYEIVNNSSTGVPPSLEKISFGRITLESDETARVLIYDIAVVGNKWEDFYIRTEDGQIVPEALVSSYNTSYLSGIVNNQKNSAHYTSPEGSFYIESRRESSESSLSLDVKNLQPGHQVLLRQSLFDPYSLLSYGRLKFWIYPEASQANPLHPDSVDVVFRIGADSLNYYQVRQRVPILPYLSKMERSLWMEFNYDLQDFTSLKEIDPEATEGENIVGNTRYSFKGSPTLTNVRNLYFGVLDPQDIDDPTPFNGTLYYNDLRVTEPYEDIGVAKRISLNSVFADVSTLDIDYEDKSENFNTNIQRGRVNTFTASKTLNILNKYFLNKLFPNSWSLDIPISLTRNYTLGIPRFRANSDLLREEIVDPEEKHRERNETLLYAADFGFSQRSAPKSKILQYTFYRSSISGRIEQSYRHNPTAVDTTFMWRGTYNYNLGFPSDKVSFRLFDNYRVGYFPTTWNNSFTLNNTEPKSWNWEKREGEYGWHPRSQTIPTKVFTSDTNINWGLTSDIALTVRLNTKRDLKQKEYIKSINIGKLTEYVQDLGLNYNPNYLREFFNLTTSAQTRFSEMQRKYYQNTNEGQIEIYQSDGNSNRSLRLNLTLMNSSLLSSLAGKLGAGKPGGKPGEEYKEEPPGDHLKGGLSDEELKKIEEEQKEEERKKEEQQKEDERKKEEELKKEEEKKREEQKDGEEGDKSYYEIDPESDDLPEDLKKILEQQGDGELPEDEEGEGEGKEEDKEDEKRPSLNLADLAGSFIGYLAKFKNISVTYQNTYIMGYSQKDDRPPFLFQLGAPHSVAEDYLDSTSDDNTISLSSGVSFSRKLDSVLGYSYTLNRQYSDASNQSVAVTFPDLTVSLLDIGDLVGLGDYMTNTRLNSGFQYTVRSTGDVDWDKPKQETRSIALNPLLGFTGTLFKNMSTNLSYSLNSGENVTDMDTYEILKTTLTHSMNGNVSYSFRSGRGFKIPFSAKKIHIKNELTSSLSIIYEKKFDETFGRESSQVDIDSNRLAISPSATYQFDANIRGGLTGTWENSSDNKRDTGFRTFSIGIWVEVNL
ncbi:MAG: hypothetical protein ACP5F3_02160, partial [Candidatus Syntrophosphaera sp.]